MASQAKDTRRSLFGFTQKGQRWGSSHPLKMGEFPPRQRIYMNSWVVAADYNLDFIFKHMKTKCGNK